MSIDPHVIWSERFEQIGSLIEANAEVLTGRWSEQALQEQRDASAAHYDEMHNRLPEFLREMGRALSQTDSTVPRPHAMLALAHGEQRWHIGWNLGEVVCDFQILRLVVLEYLDTCLEKPLTTREVMAIGLALDEGISASVMAYVGHQENALREANSRLTEFLPVLGHELRNPLSAVVGAMELINLSRVQDEVLREAHKIVERQVHQIIRLVDDMLDISRIMRGQLAVRAELLDVRKIVQEAGDLHRPLFSERDQTLTLSLPKEPLWIRADPGRLRQVLTNLLNNAMKYTEPKGQIVVDADKRDDRIVISVRDTGVGIQEDLLPGIFDMFAQGPQHKHQGLGIGLALVRALVQTHGGTIKATSAGPGKGSEFTIELPEARQEVPQSEPASSVEKHPAKAAACYRILLVDDHQDGA
ncbi:MAG TPA: HAMP domain-containing sensor histidine kinase, partial [Pirellulales bacterium]